jgi:hypothetical protein
MEKHSHRNETFLIYHPGEPVPIGFSKINRTDKFNNYSVFNKDGKLVGSALTTESAKAVARLLGS